MRIKNTVNIPPNRLFPTNTSFNGDINHVIVEFKSKLMMCLTIQNNNIINNEGIKAEKEFETFSGTLSGNLIRIFLSKKNLIISTESKDVIIAPNNEDALISPIFIYLSLQFVSFTESVTCIGTTEVIRNAKTAKSPELS